MSEEKNDPTVELVAVVLMFLSVVPLVIFGGYTYMKLWFWFLVPLGVPAIGIANAIGINLLISFSTNKAKLKDGYSNNVERLLSLWAIPLIVLVLGAIVHSFM